MSNILSSLKEQILSRKCAVHRFSYSDILLLDPNQEQHRICSKCLIQRKSFEKVVPIPDLLDLDSSSKLPIYPLIDNEELQKMVRAELNLDKMCNQIEDYYKKLLISIKETIQKLIKRDQEIMQKQIQEWKKSSKKLQEILSISPLLELLKSKDIEENELHQYIVKRYDTIEKQMESIKKNFKRIKELESTFSFKSPLNIEQEIFKKIEAIDLFSGENSIVIQQSLIKKQDNLNINHFIGQDKFSSLQIIPSQYYSQSGKNLKIQKMNNLTQITNISNSNDQFRQCYLFPELSPKKKYIIQLSYNNSYDAYPYFIFGLLDSLFKDSCQINGAYFREISGGNCIQIIKGQHLHSFTQKRIGIKKLEFRIHISENIFRVSSPPTYQNIVELPSKEKIDQSRKFLFGISIANPGDSVTLEQFLEIDQFDSLM